MNTAFHERITQARELAGLSKTELADKLQVTVAAVSQWENGSKKPTAENLFSISCALKVPMPMLMNAIPTELSVRGPVSFRARAAAKTAARKRQAQRLAELVSELYIWLEKWVSFPVPSLPDVSGLQPEKAAAQCRKAWGLGDRPITKLGELLESKGIRICAAAFGDVRFDAYSCIISGRPFQFLGIEKQDRARSRFDAAHELGHLIMHQHYSDDEMEANKELLEGEADAFSSAFLLPAETFSREVVDTRLEGFKMLKPKWGVSIQAMVRRARDLNLITQETYERHYRNMSAAGWRRAQCEPLDELVPTVNRTLGKRSLELLTSTGNMKPWEIPIDLPLPGQVFQSVFDTDLSAMVPDELNKVVVLSEFARNKTQPGA